MKAQWDKFVRFLSHPAVLGAGTVVLALVAIAAYCNERDSDDTSPTATPSVTTTPTLSRPTDPVITDTPTPSPTSSPSVTLTPIAQACLDEFDCGGRLFATNGGCAIDVNIAAAEAAEFTSALWVTFVPPVTDPILLSADTHEASSPTFTSPAEGTELLFYIVVTDTENNVSTWYTGPADRNSDRRIHAAVKPNSSTSFEVGFEDAENGGFVDIDQYNDVLFLVDTSCP